MLELQTIEKGSKNFSAVRKLIIAFSNAAKVPLYDLICLTPERVSLFGVYENKSLCGCAYLLRHENTVLAYYMTYEKRLSVYGKEDALRELLTAQYPHYRIILDIKIITE